ncbi:MAG: serine/threonine protein kinase [Deltaproteobacteria bacterium]|nr:serine/threonine protein kinase [Nannocystaceae bacterium]
MSERLAFLPFEHELLGEAIDVGTETRWRIRLADGTTAVVGQLAPDLARDLSIRRRYVHDVERMMKLTAYSVAPTLALGPEPDPRAPGPVSPWRLRHEPGGESLTDWLARAPMPIEEAAEMFAAIADAVHAVHLQGAVLRDLRPEQIVRTAHGRIVLVDVGLARVDVLSSHTASSLLLRGSSYVAPEQLLRTAVDQRSDLWSLGVMLWQALTGTLPFGDGPPLLADHDRLPSLQSLRRDAPPALEDLVRRCLDRELSGRPGSATEIAWVLRGGISPFDGDAIATCQHCHQRLRVAQRLCLSCGRVAVRFQHAPDEDGSYALDLVKLDEDVRPLKWLQEFLGDVSVQPMRRPEFVIGSIHMYSEEERAARIRLPARLYGQLTRETAERLHALATKNGLRTRIVRPSEVAGAWSLIGMFAAVAVLITLGLAALGTSPWWSLGPAIPMMVLLFANLNEKIGNQRQAQRYFLRPTPAALPASDPLVARLAALMKTDPPGDVKAVIGELALLVQRLVDHRASLLGPQHHEIAVLTAPIEPIVVAVEQHVQELRRISDDLAKLDEGAMVRALSASEARDEPAAARQAVLDGLDRLRAVEDHRAALFHRLLEAKSLLERTVRLGLAVHDPAQEHDRQIALALATLGGGD